MLAIFDRYHIVAPSDLRDAACKLEVNQQKEREALEKIPRVRVWARFLHSCTKTACKRAKPPRRLFGTPAFLPRILGVWLMLNCFAYLATSVTGILWPHYEQRVSNWPFPIMFGELAVMLWLIITGAKVKHPRATAA